MQIILIKFIFSLQKIFISFILIFINYKKPPDDYRTLESANEGDLQNEFRACRIYPQESVSCY